ncbi:17739_t:CDS:1, partial [Funneliformis geosporum]
YSENCEAAQRSFQNFLEEDSIETSLKDNTSLISAVEVIFKVRGVSWHPCFASESALSL